MESDTLHFCICPGKSKLSPVFVTGLPIFRTSLINTVSSMNLYYATLWHMEVPRPGVKLVLQLSAYAIPIPTGIAVWDPSHVFDLYHRSWRPRILNPVSEARDKPSSSWIPVRFLTHWATREILSYYIFLAIPMACGNSWVRYLSLATEVTWAIVVTMLSP